MTNEDYCKRAVELGHTIISSCEHGNQGHYRECADLAKQYDLRWRYVAEAYMVKDRFEKDSTNAHIILAAKTTKGVGDLNEALSEANITGYYYRPRVDMDLLLSLDPNDVFITTACVGGIFKYGFEDARQIILTLASHFRDSMMLEVQYHDTDKQREVNDFLLTLYRQHGIPLIMGVDSHFIYPEDKALRDMRLEASHIKYDYEDFWHMDYPSGEEAAQRFIKQGVLSRGQIDEAIENTNVFLTFEDVVLDKSKKLPTLYPSLTQEERNQLYLDTVWDEWSRYSQGMTQAEKDVREASIRAETETIVSTNTSDYFLLDYAIVKRAKEMGGVVTPTGRGSSVGFFTNTLLGFSSVDRHAIPVEMFPDRFISADRLLAGNLPDIDQNVANEDIFIQAQTDVMGEWKSAQMVAFGTMRRLSAWKMHCRANNVPFEQANEISDSLKAYETARKHADDADEILLEEFVPPEHYAMVRQSEAYMGVVDSISPHPCAHLLCQNDVRREIGIIRITSKGRKKKTIYAAFIDGATAEQYGYLKNDWLHADVVEINHAAYKRIGLSVPTVQELLLLTKGDRETWRMYADGLTMGLNQVERPNTRAKVMQYKPHNITELAAFVAAVRPSFQSMINTFLQRQRFTYNVPIFDRLIQTREMPNSFILYQEQVMKTLQYGGMTGPESYAAIKAIAKKHPEQVLPMKQRFLQAFGRRIQEDDPSCAEDKAIDMATKVWQIIEDATNYGFNSSHAVCVALDSLYGAYAKAHYPLEYYTALLQTSAQKGDRERISLVKQEMLKGFGIRVVPCRFRQDNRDFYIDREANAIADALTSIKFISQRVADALYLMREKDYASFIDLLYDMEIQSAFNSNSVSILIQLDYFVEFGSAGKLMKIHAAFKDGPNHFSKQLISSSQQKRLELLRQETQDIPEETIPVPERVRFEIEHCGTLLSTFPDCRGQYAVLEVDDRYSPKLRLYNLASGAIGTVKIKKATYQEQPLAVGDLIRLQDWQRRPAYAYVGGKAMRREGVHEIWMQKYVRIE